MSSITLPTTELANLTTSTAPPNTHLAMFSGNHDAASIAAVTSTEYVSSDPFSGIDPGFFSAMLNDTSLPMDNNLWTRSNPFLENTALGGPTFDMTLFAVDAGRFGVYTSSNVEQGHRFDTVPSGQLEVLLNLETPASEFSTIPIGSSDSLSLSHQPLADIAVQPVSELPRTEPDTICLPPAQNVVADATTATLFNGRLKRKLIESQRAWRDNAASDFPAKKTMLASHQQPRRNRRKRVNGLSRHLRRRQRLRTALAKG
ncbi:hypothetical protein JVU11DRAFT_9119 [Chiua virens]|nr:hypothetical protein JVU11DRAFT_9119 [Chiua virens]